MADEIKEEKLDSPLVVHKKGDASYQEEGNEVSMQNTHVDEDSDAPTLERHRFKKEKKKKGKKISSLTLLCPKEGMRKKKEEIFLTENRQRRNVN